MDPLHADKVPHGVNCYLVNTVHRINRSVGQPYFQATSALVSAVTRNIVGQLNFKTINGLSSVTRNTVGHLNFQVINTHKGFSSVTGTGQLLSICQRPHATFVSYKTLGQLNFQAINTHSGLSSVTRNTVGHLNLPAINIHNGLSSVIILLGNSFKAIYMHKGLSPVTPPTLLGS